jgi:hypothetical protein
MRKIFQIIGFCFIVFCSNENSFGQEKSNYRNDEQLKETLYKKFKKEIQSYSKKQFDELFFEFFKKQNDDTILLSKEEYYGYTMKIAAYSEKLGLLYKSEKEASEKAKQDWLAKNYQDYVISKKKNP